MPASTLQAALDFLACLSDLDSTGRVAASAIPASLNYAVLADLAAAGGYTVDATDIPRAFRILMRSRHLASVRFGLPRLTP
jgi:hypothetical protein